MATDIIIPRTVRVINPRLYDDVLMNSFTELDNVTYVMIDDEDDDWEELSQEIASTVNEDASLFNGGYVKVISTLFSSVRDEDDDKEWDDLSATITTTVAKQYPLRIIRPGEKVHLRIVRPRRN